MNIQELKPGFEFANLHELTPKERIVLLPFFDKIWNVQDLAKKVSMHQKTLHNLIRRLVLKKLVIKLPKCEVGMSQYRFNHDANFNKQN